MPPKNVRTIRELIYWEYAKLVSGSATGDRRNYRFVMYTYQRLLAGKAHPSAILRENKHLFEEEHRCAVCTRREAEHQRAVRQNPAAGAEREHRSDAEDHGAQQAGALSEEARPDPVHQPGCAREEEHERQP